MCGGRQRAALPLNTQCLENWTMWGGRSVLTFNTSRFPQTYLQYMTYKHSFLRITLITIIAYNFCVHFFIMLIELWNFSREKVNILLFYIHICITIYAISCLGKKNTFLFIKQKNSDLTGFEPARLGYCTILIFDKNVFINIYLFY